MPTLLTKQSHSAVFISSTTHRRSHRRFSHIHVELVGPHPSCSGINHLLTIVDRSTRWLEAIPLQSTTATANALVAGWIARFDVPADLTSDRGVQFSSEVWAILMSRLGIRHHLTTAYHPQSNGMVERTHRQLKDALRSRLAGDNWLAHLPYVLLSLRATPKEDSNISSAELVYGASILLPGHLQQGPEPPPAAFAATDSGLPWWIPTRPPSVLPAPPHSLIAWPPPTSSTSGRAAFPSRSPPLTAAPTRFWSSPPNLLRSTLVAAQMLSLSTASSHTWEPPLFYLPQHPGEEDPLPQQRVLAARHLGWGSVAELLLQ